jgi:hypothetical protein
VRFGLTPSGGGRDDLPVEVGTWLMPVQMAIDKATREASKG